MRTIQIPIGHLLAVVLTAGCAAVADPGHAGPPDARPAAEGLTVQLRESFYGVRGDTPRALNRALRVAAPRHRGRRAYGLTDWTLRWRYRVLPGARSCRVTDPEIHLALTTQLPRWENRERAASTVADDWDLFMARLRDHEAGHRERVIREAVRALEAFRELHAPSCADLRSSVRETVLRAEDRMWEANRHYDRSTDYGLSQASGVAGGR